jgi:transposase
LEQYAPLSQCAVLLEKTGHYHLPLKQFLQSIGVRVYEIHVVARSRNKSDKADALRLANTLYNQIELHAHPGDDEQAVRLAKPRALLAAQLGGLAKHYKNLSKDITRRENKLTAIADQLFPELTLVLSDPNCATALRLRRQYPTAQAVADADPLALWQCGCRGGRGRPGKSGMLRLHALAQQSIALQNEAIVEALCFEQECLIDQLVLLREHREAVDRRATEIISGSREGKILMSLGIISAIEAATIISGIGDIRDFESASKLKSYLGWAPNKQQTGTSKDSEKLTRSGNRLLRDTMYLVGWHAIRYDTEWRKIYQRLVPVKCAWNPRTKQYEGKNKVLGRVIGQVIGLIFLLLKKDAVLRSHHKGDNLPEPTVYDRAFHARRRG